MVTGDGPGVDTDTSTSAVTASELVRRYGDRAAIDGVSFTLPASRTIAVFGANGAGKTTLLRLLAGLLRPHGGALSVLGRALPAQTHALRGRVGLVTHEPLLYRDLTGRENLRFVARLNGAAPARVDALLEATEMIARADDPVHDLSKGMVQRLAVCRALLSEPDLLLLDEPYANLDPHAVELLAPLIGPGCGLARVLVTHDVVAGLSEADRVLGLRAGRVAISSAAGDLTADDLRELYR